MKKNIFAISGSTRANSSNLNLIYAIADLCKDDLNIIIFNSLSELPHFNPDLDTENPPLKIVDLREQISKADGVLICTPEYVFSLPGSLKNMLEWMVSTTLFQNKPMALITAGASGEKAHEQLQLIIKTIEGKFTNDTQLLIQGVKGKINDTTITDQDTLQRIKNLIYSFNNLLKDQ